VGEERTPGREEVTDARGRDWQESIVGMLGSAWSCAWVDFRCEPGSPAALAFAVDRTREILTVVLGAWSETFGDRDLVLALQALQDLGEGYALLTQSWPIGTEVAPSIPDRRIVETNLGSASPSSLCEFTNRGIVLELDRSSVGGDARLSADPMPAKTEGQVATYSAKLIRTYCEFLTAWEHELGRPLILQRAAKFRLHWCEALSLSRRMFDAQGALADQGGVSRKAILLCRLIADCHILASTAEDEHGLAEIPLLSRGFIDEQREALGINDLLREHGVDLSGM